MEPTPSVTPLAESARRRALNGMLLGALSGALCVGCAAPHDLWPLAPLIFAPLMVACQGEKPAILATGLGHGAAITLGALYYVLAALHEMAGLSWLSATVLWSCLALANGLKVCLALWLTRSLARLWRAPALVLPCAWVFAEWLTPVLFPWPIAALGQGFPPWLQLAEFGGPLLVSFWLAAVGAFVGDAVIQWRQSGSRRALAPMTTGVLIVLVATVSGKYLERRAEQNASGAPLLRVGVVQGGDRPTSPLDRRDTLQRYRQLTLDLLDKHGRLDLVVWPETILLPPIAEEKLESYLRSYVRTDRREGIASRILDVPVLLGLNIEHAATDGATTLTNSAVLFDGTGHLSGSYDKHMLVPVGEQAIAIPIPGVSPWELLAPVTRYRAGTGSRPLKLNDHALSVLICYEDMFPWYVRGLVNDGGAEALVSLSSDAWFEADLARELHFMLASLRAVETRRYLLRATHDGLSGLVAPTGARVWSLPSRVLASDVVSLRWISHATLYSRFGDIPMLLFSAIAMISGVGASRLRRPRLPTQLEKDRAFDETNI